MYLMKSISKRMSHSFHNKTSKQPNKHKVFDNSSSTRKFYTSLTEVPHKDNSNKFRWGNHNTFKPFMTIDSKISSNPLNTRSKQQVTVMPLQLTLSPTSTTPSGKEDDLQLNEDLYSQFAGSKHSPNLTSQVLVDTELSTSSLNSSTDTIKPDVIKSVIETVVHNESHKRLIEDDVDGGDTADRFDEDLYLRPISRTSSEYDELLIHDGGDSNRSSVQIDNTTVTSMHDTDDLASQVSDYSTIEDTDDLASQVSDYSTIEDVLLDKSDHYTGDLVSEKSNSTIDHVFDSATVKLEEVNHAIGDDTSVKSSYDENDYLLPSQMKESQYLTTGSDTSVKSSYDENDYLLPSQMKESQYLTTGSDTSVKSSYDENDYLLPSQMKESQHLTTGSDTSVKSSYDENDYLLPSQMKESQHLTTGNDTSSNLSSIYFTMSDNSSPTTDDLSHYATIADVRYSDSVHSIDSGYLSNSSSPTTDESGYVTVADTPIKSAIVRMEEKDNAFMRHKKKSDKSVLSVFRSGIIVIGRTISTLAHKISSLFSRTDSIKASTDITEPPLISHTLPVTSSTYPPIKSTVRSLPTPPVNFSTRRSDMSYLSTSSPSNRSNMTFNTLPMQFVEKEPLAESIYIDIDTLGDRGFLSKEEEKSNSLKEQSISLDDINLLVPEVEHPLTTAEDTYYTMGSKKHTSSVNNVKDADDTYTNYAFDNEDEESTNL